MPRPTPDDPNLCTGSAEDLTTSSTGWLVCGKCTRVLKQRGAHRVRSRTTRSLDKLRDSLLGFGYGPALEER